MHFNQVFKNIQKAHAKNFFLAKSMPPKCEQISWRPNSGDLCESSLCVEIPVWFKESASAALCDRWWVIGRRREGSKTFLAFRTPVPPPLGDNCACSTVSSAFGAVRFRIFVEVNVFMWDFFKCAQ
jgi:hypothetical protein